MWKSSKGSNMMMHQEFSLEDCDALLKFPFHQYADEIKQEIDCDLPVLGDAGKLVINEGFQVEKQDSEKVPMARTKSVNKDFKTKLQKLHGKLEILQEQNINNQFKLYRAQIEEEKFKDMYEKKRISKPISLFAAPYFRDNRGMGAPDNEDTIIKRKHHDVNAYLQPPKAWLQCEKEKLVDGVMANALCYVVKPYKIKRDHLRDKLKNDKNIEEFEMHQIRKQIKKIQKEISKQSQRSPLDIYQEAEDHIDWLEVSATHMEGSKSYLECEIMWKNCMSISVNKKRPTKEEDARLVDLVREHNGENWDLIAEELQTGRTAVQCFERYQRHLNEHLRKKYWTPEEDEELIKVVGSFRVGNFIPWNQVCCLIEGRERHQIINRYERTANKKLNRGPWSQEEDAMLLVCERKFGQKWSKMIEFFPERNAYLCRERFVNMIDPSISHSLWSKEEDLKMIDLIKKYGFGKWAKIAREMPGRTDNMCLTRGRTLRTKLLDKFKFEEDLKGRLEDSEDFLENLKTVAGRAISLRRKSKKKSRHITAFETLKSALMNVTPIVAEDLDVKTMNIPTLSLNTLRSLHKELFKDAGSTEKYHWEPRYMSYDGVTRRNFKQPTRKWVDFHEKDGVQEDEEYEIDNPEVEEVKMDYDERLWYEKVVQAQIENEEKLLQMPAYTRRINLNKRESMEFNIYDNYLQQIMKCSEINKEDTNCTYRGVDYNVSVTDHIHNFIQPLVKEGPALLSANWTTVRALDIMEGIGLRNVAGFMDHSITCVRYVSGLSSDLPKCVRCCSDETSNTAEEKYDVTLNVMKSNLIVPDDEDMRKFAMVEAGLPSVQEMECCCNELIASKEAADLLLYRFTSLFMWPYLLRSVGLLKEQDKLCFKTMPNLHPNIPKYQPSKNTKGCSPQKRKRGQTDTNAAKKRIAAEMNKSPDRNPSIRMPSLNSQASQQSLRRSRRKCVLKRQQIAY